MALLLQAMSNLPPSTLYKKFAPSPYSSLSKLECFDSAALRVRASLDYSTLNLGVLSKFFFGLLVTIEYEVDYILYFSYWFIYNQKSAINFIKTLKK